MLQPPVFSSARSQTSSVQCKFPLDGATSSGFHRALWELGEKHERELQAVREQLESKALIQLQEAEKCSPNSSTCEHHKAFQPANSAGTTSSEGHAATAPAAGIRRSVGALASKWRRSSRSNSFVGGPANSKKRAVSPGGGKLNVLSEDLALIKGWKQEDQAARHHSEKKLTKFRFSNLSKMVDNQCFDAFCSVMIISNAVMMGVSVDWGVKNYHQRQTPAALDISDRVFTAWFLLELFLRMCGHGLTFFLTKENWTWNLFDFVVVMSDVLATILSAGDPSGKKPSSSGNVSLVRLLRVIRVIRALRIVRIFRFFRELRMMVFSVLKSGTSLLWSVVILCLDVFLFAVYFTQQVTSHFQDSNKLDFTERSDAKLLEFFGSITRAMYTLFMSVSGGISWVEVSTPLMEIHWTNVVVWVFFIFFTIHALTNIITGIFVDTAIMSAQSDRDEVIQTQLHHRHSTLQQMRDLFVEADLDDSGTISLQELEVLLSDPRVRAHLTALGLQLDEARGLFRLLDMNKSGALNIDEFIFGCMRLKGNARSIDLATLMYENKKMFTMMSSFFEYAEEEFRKMRTILMSGAADGLQRGPGAPPGGAAQKGPEAGGPQVRVSMAL